MTIRLLPRDHRPQHIITIRGVLALPFTFARPAASGGRK